MFDGVGESNPGREVPVADAAPLRLRVEAQVDPMGHAERENTTISKLTLTITTIRSDNITQHNDISHNDTHNNENPLTIC